MISFSEYVKLNQNKAYNHTDVVVPEVKVKKIVNDIAPAPIKEKDVYDYLKEINPQVWSAKIVNNVKYLFFNGHYLNMEELNKSLKNIYSSNGYENYGFSKLDESDLIRYKTVRDIISNDFLNDSAPTELDYNEVAQRLFDKEIKDFEWKPQPLNI